MQLIDRYVREIGRRLPQKSRADIEKEIRSALEDMLEDRSKQENRAVDEEMTVQALKEYGNPEKVAASYLPEQYLIGPQLFPVFWLVVQIVFGVLTALTLVALVLHFAGGDFLPVEIGKSFFGLLANYFGGLMTAFGNIVLVFAIIQRFAPSWKEDLKDEDWNPRDLPEVEDSNQVSRTGTIVETVFIVLALILFNLYPQYIGIYGFTTDNGSFFVPILSRTFFSYMPWINLLWGLQIALNVLLIQRMRWQVGTRWFSIAIKAGGIALAYAMLNGPSIINLTPEVLMTEMSFSAHAAQQFASLIGQVVIVALWISIVAGAVEIIQALVKIVRAQVSPATA